MSDNQHFKVSSFIKDIIGRDLVTNEYAAIFELVKNSLDASATTVDIIFDMENSNITIVDDGLGMSAKDINDKWLFVAYSDKAVRRQETYRDKITPPTQFAGSKGIGRFACDTLGEKLELYTRTEGSPTVSNLIIDWTDFEQNNTDEFQKVDVILNEEASFPNITGITTPKMHGTMLLITKARHKWDKKNIKKLRSELTKLIDPFGTTQHATISIRLNNSSELFDQQEFSDLTGPIGNNVADILKEKTSRIDVVIKDDIILTTLFDRGKQIYKIEEPLPYEELKGCTIHGEIYYLNKSAKQSFTSRMGVQPVKFGSIFLFLNKFRISPIGDELDDTFGLNRRSQQGQKRYFGTRDVLGRVDVSAPPKLFREVSSRDAGLVEDAHSRALFEAIRKHMIFRLERYVVGVNWPDRFDKFRDTPEGLESDEARERILAIIGGIARSKEIKILYYDKDLIQVSDDVDEATSRTLRDISDLAKSSGDNFLYEKVESARKRIEELKSSREEALKVAAQAQRERERADAKIERLEQQAAFLESSLDVDVDKVQLLMHEAIIHVNHVESAVANASRDVNDLSSQIHTLIKNNSENKELGQSSKLEDSLISMRSVSKTALTSLASATLSTERLKTILSLAPNIKFNLDTGKIRGDLLKFLDELFKVRLAGLEGMPKANFDNGGLTLKRKFSPVDIAIVVNNLLDNSRKAKATSVFFKAVKKGKNSVAILVTDDGLGIDRNRVNPSKIFERGYTSSPRGTGLGLYNVRKIIEEMGGKIILLDNEGRADFEITLPEETEIEP